MGGYDEHVAIIGDWMPPSPSPRAFFSAMLGDDDDIGLRSISEPTGVNKNDNTLFHGTQHHRTSSADDNENEYRARAGDQETKPFEYSEQKMGSRGGGLLERRAGFNAPRLNTESIRPPGLLQNQELRSPYLTIPPGLSPTTLLDSPVFLSNSLVQPSPTTGKFPFPPSGSGRSSMFMRDGPDKTKDNFFDSFTSSSSFAFKPVAESTPSLFLGAASKATPSTLPQQSFPSIEVSVQSDNSILPRNVEPAKVHSQNGTSLHLQADYSRSSAEKDSGGGANISSEPRAFDRVGGSAEHSPPLDEEQEVEDPDQRVSGDNNVGSAPSEDGYNWRKYGQKQVKGSEYPRSYYKCTHPNCPVKKKVERSHEGHITEIIYKGTHNHPKPPPNRRSAVGSSNAISDMQFDGAEQAVDGGDQVWTTMQKGGGDWRQDNLEVTSSGPLGPEYGNNATNNLQAQYESADAAVDRSSTFSNEEDEDDRATHGSVSVGGYDGEGDESESKRRKVEAYAADVSGATRAIREPRVVVQTTSEVDILDDGYRWRKYGQKVVKGNPNPRSYYKCTNAGCSVRKHVERASHDLKSVITTYEGKHNHDVPAARNSSHVNSNSTISSSQSGGGGGGGLSQVHRPEPSQLQNNMARFERPHSIGSFGLPPGMNHRQQLGGVSHGFGFGMNQQGLANLAMAGFGPNQGRMPTTTINSATAMPVHSYLGQPPRAMNDMGFMMPKGEPKVEPMLEPGLNLTNGLSVYHQIMSRLPLGPHM